MKESSTPFVIFLASRGDVVSNGFVLWRQRSNLSYGNVGSYDSFAQRAPVVTEYPASTLLIDDYLGLEIQFDSLDDELDEYTFIDAQENRLLVFVGDEILSVWSAELLGVGRYRLWTIRARYDTRRQTHPVDAEVWVALAEDLHAGRRGNPARALLQASALPASERNRPGRDPSRLSNLPTSRLP